MRETTALAVFGRPREDDATIPLNA